MAVIGAAPSRYDGATRVTDANGVVSLGLRDPLRFDATLVRTQHLVREGDTLWSIAELYFGGLADPALLWPLLAEFQPDPIVDPTLVLMPGTYIYVPRVEGLQEVLGL